MIIHRASDGEELYGIAHGYGIAPSILREAVGADGVKKFNGGRELIIPTATRTYSVRVGDTLKGICDRFGVRAETVMALNPELCGEDRLYQGQILILKSGAQNVGIGVNNGYCYPGCTRSRIMRYLPYASFVTVQAARAVGKEIRLDEWDGELTELLCARGKIPLLRIYVDKMPSPSEYTDFIRAATLVAKSRGYLGITLANLRAESEALKELVLEARRSAMENELLLVTEGEIGKDVGYTEYSDHAVLTYDKLHLDKIPTFDEGERKALNDHSGKYEVLGSFVELPAFALRESGYMPREELFAIMDRRGTVITHDDERKIMLIQPRGERILAESVENTKAKLALVGELGYMGISFDMLRVPVFELLLVRSMLGEAAGIGSTVRLNCRGEDGYSSAAI